MLTLKRAAVLRELDWLGRESPAWAREADGGWWLPYHVVFFRGSGKTGLNEYAPSWAYGLMDVNGARRQLLALHKSGLADRYEVPGMSVRYRINDAGTAALREHDSGKATS